METSAAPSWLTIYAAIVATGALLLNFKSWFESGVRLHATIIPDGMIIGAGETFDDEKDIIIVTVANRGRTSTMVTNLTLHRFDTFLQRVRSRPVENYVVANPQLKGYPPNIPTELEPGKRWTGVVRKRPDQIPDLGNGRYYVAVATTHKDRHVLKRIPRKKVKLAGLTTTV